jgi:HAD superfamily hydrolase (TIGR01484 family)
MLMSVDAAFADDFATMRGMKRNYHVGIMPKAFAGKELVVFDLDGTLTETKSNMKPDMAAAIRTLLKAKKVAIVGGGSYPQFRKQFLVELRCPSSLLPNLFLFPETATSFYRYLRGWKKVYSFRLSKAEEASIKKAFKCVLKEIHYIPPRKTYGKVLEDRGAEFTFSALGQDVVAQLGEKGVRLKERWTDKHGPLKIEIAKLVQKRLPNLEVHPAGFTSIDVTEHGVDKAYGVRQIQKRLHVPIKHMLFVGDALYPGGNDYAAKRTGIDCVAVKGPRETKRVIEKLID